MIKKIIASMLLLYTFLCYAQIDYKYLYIDQTNNILLDNNTQVFCCSKEIRQIEPNLFKIDCKSLNIDVKIQNKIFQINLDKLSDGDKFINLSIFFRPETNSDDVIVFIKRGDLIKKLQGNCKDKSLCHIITLEFPKVIVIDEKYETTINSVFSKYIFD